MLVGLGLLFISYGLFTVASSNLLGVDVHHPQLASSSYPQILLAQKALGQVGVWLMLLATLLTAVMTFNGGFTTASRFLYAAAREDTMPPLFSRISISFAVPSISIIALAVASAFIAIIIFLTGQFQVLILVGASPTTSGAFGLSVVF
jgi:basic amino acid/polyamine antiporter, APA family